MHHGGKKTFVVISPFNFSEAILTLQTTRPIIHFCLDLFFIQICILSIHTAYIQSNTLSNKECKNAYSHFMKGNNFENSVNRNTYMLLIIYFLCRSYVYYKYRWIYLFQIPLIGKNVVVKFLITYFFLIILICFISLKYYPSYLFTLSTVLW